MSKELADLYNDHSEALRDKFRLWDEIDAAAHGKVENRAMHEHRSQMSDGRLGTILRERSAQVTGQLPTGVVRAITKADRGQGLLMQLVLFKQIIPNENWGGPHLEKLRIADFNSKRYGIQPVITDWVDGGPAFRLIDIRNYTPQKGYSAIEDMDYVFVDTYHSEKWLQDKKKDKEWNSRAIDKVLKANSPSVKDYERQSYIEKERTHSEAKYIHLVTKYGREKWITFDPKSGEIVRERDAKGIPVLVKKNFPTGDDHYGISEFERGLPMQKGMDTLLNLFADGMKRDIYKPLIVNPNGVIPTSLKNKPDARWLETIPNSIREHQTNAGSLNLFLQVYTFMTGSLLNMNGTTDTTVNAESGLDPGFGKTPAAIKQLAARESTRVQEDRHYLEQFIEQLYDRFIDLILDNDHPPFEVSVFEEEINTIVNSGYKDVEQLIKKGKKDGQRTKIVIEKDQLKRKNTEYKFYIEGGSTMQRDRAVEHEVWGEMLLAFSKMPGLNEALAEEEITFHFGELLKKWANSGGADEVEQVIRSMTDEDKKKLEEKRKKAAEEAKAAQVQIAQQPGQDQLSAVQGQQGAPGLNGADPAAIQAQLAQQQQAVANPAVGVQTASTGLSQDQIVQQLLSGRNL